MDPKTHPAVTVTNIKNFIPFTLEMESGQYTSWAELFRIHCRAFQVANHINSSAAPPRSTPSSSTATEADKTKVASEFEAWSRLDAIVLQWIYSTISNDLLHTILKPNTTASQAWTALENIFQDSRNTRAIYLDSKFVSTRLDQHPNVSSYCQAMKMIADQLANVGNPVNNQRLVLQLIAGLNDSYEGVAMLIQQTNPLPDFYEVRSKLVMKEARKAHQAAAIAASPNNTLQPPPRLCTSLLTTGPATITSHGKIHVAEDMAVAADVAVAAPPADEDATTPNNRHMVGDPLRTSHGHLFRLLGLTQSTLNGYIHHAHTRSSSPTSAHPLLHLLEFWAIVHNKLMRLPKQVTHPRTSNKPSIPWRSIHPIRHGNFTSYVNNGLFRNVIVGDGSPIPIRGIGHQTLPYPFPPLLLKNVLHTPRIIKNLLSIRHFTIDNNVSVEFDPFGLTMKEYRTRTPILRCNSTGDLYSFKLNSSSQVTHPSTFAAITRDLWHHRLGHPGADVLSTLRSNLRFSSSKHLSSNTFCHSCVLGKQIKFSFSSSNSLTHLPFDIIHTDVWTSPVLSSSGHRYYVLFLDDKTNYLWTYPLANKSQVFSTFLHFFSMIKTQFHYTIKTIQCDNGREFDNQQFHNLCSQTSTQFRFSCPYTSPQNGKPERKIRSINNLLRTLLAHSNVPMYLWHHALQHATYLLNILPTKTLANLTPTHLL
ncbi:hypothetical protein OSB04_007760 [Centaurea solstitialis]|uniref:Integrase catalytic domain-containing protein n=1 Tax=Centaurea solstitialis TaxID=347529 RepID=A0AA38TX42_9ASTR|nr:hypothetical protein OSB04_007760 [Centaurea solstitialis]